MSEQPARGADDDPYRGRRPTGHERRTGRPWDASYLDGPAPWDTGRPQPAVVRLAAEGAFAGAVLDAGLDRTFDTVLDCGLFHALDAGERRDYVASLASVTAGGGTLHLLCFSDAEPERAGPHPVRRAWLRAAFAAGSGWSVASIQPERVQARFAEHGAPAWLARIERTGRSA